MKSKYIWGTFMLLAAAFVIANQLEGFATLGVGTIIVALLALAFIVQFLVYLSIASLPIPLAVLYIVLQQPFDLPYIQHWVLIVAAILTSIGLSILLPGKRWRGPKAFVFKPETKEPPPEMSYESINNENNPSINVNFGAVSRNITADNLETVQLYCHFGALEILISNETKLSPNGAEVMCNCSTGAIRIDVPKHWRIINHVNCSVGAVDIDKCFASSAEDAPQLTLKGSVSLGAIEIGGI